MDRKVDKIILHCSDSDAIAHNDISVINTWHKARGFKMVGYHYFITKGGAVQKGRPLDDDAILEPNEVGAHTKGENFNSIGICLHGKNRFEFNQFRALAKLCIKLMEQFNLTIGDIYPHNYFNDKKTCPNFDVAQFIKKYLSDGPGYNKIHNEPKQGAKSRPITGNRKGSGKSKSKAKSSSGMEPKAKRKSGPAPGKTRKTGSSNK